MGMDAVSSVTGSAVYSSRLRSIDLRPPNGGPGNNGPSVEPDQQNVSQSGQSKKNDGNESSDGTTPPSLGPSNRFSLISSNSDNGSSSPNNGPGSETVSAGESSEGEASGPARLSPQERRVVQRLKRIDAKVRAHEQAHLAAAGQYAQGGISFEYVTGPDGKEYAVGGEVSLDTSKASSPGETVNKMRQVKAAALAPANPSPQDQQIAAQATRKLAKARQEQQQQRAEQISDSDQADNDNSTNEQNGISSNNDSSSDDSNVSPGIEQPEDFGVEIGEQVSSFIEEKNSENSGELLNNSRSGASIDSGTNRGDSENNGNGGRSDPIDQFVTAGNGSSQPTPQGQVLNLLA